MYSVHIHLIDVLSTMLFFKEMSYSKFSFVEIQIFTILLLL